MATVLASPLRTALGGLLSAWLGAQHTLLAPAEATIVIGPTAKLRIPGISHRLVDQSGL
jgi:hypothetical protein